MYRLLVYILLIAAFAGSYAYIIDDKVHLIRILPILVLPFLFSLRAKLNKLNLIFLSVFTFYFVYTIISSLLHWSTFSLNDFLNFLVLTVFFYCAFFLANSKPVLFFSCFRIFLSVFCIAAFAFAIHEEVTNTHLYNSALATYPVHWENYHLPTFLYTNPNDLAAIYLLSVMFLLSTTGLSRIRYKGFLNLFLIGSCFWVCWFTDSRLNFAVFVLYLLAYFEVWKIRYLLWASAAIAIAALVVSYKNVDYHRIASFETGAGSSINERIDIYWVGIKSIVTSYGLGYGVGSSRYYYQEIAAKEISGKIIDPHSYLIELLINSGIVNLLGFMLLNIFVLTYFVKKRYSLSLVLQFCFYHLILFSSSSSVFLWPHYVFFIIYLTFTQDEVAKLIQKPN